MPECSQVYTKLDPERGVVTLDAKEISRWLINRRSFELQQIPMQLRKSAMAGGMGGGADGAAAGGRQLAGMPGEARGMRGPGPVGAGASGSGGGFFQTSPNGTGPSGAGPAGGKPGGAGSAADAAYSSGAAFRVAPSMMTMPGSEAAAAGNRFVLPLAPLPSSPESSLDSTSSIELDEPSSAGPARKSSSGSGNGSSAPQQQQRKQTQQQPAGSNGTVAVSLGSGIQIDAGAANGSGSGDAAPNAAQASPSQV